MFVFQYKLLLYVTKTQQVTHAIITQDFIFTVCIYIITLTLYIYKYNKAIIALIEKGNNKEMSSTEFCTNIEERKI